jgi:hypothetical protein
LKNISQNFVKHFVHQKKKTDWLHDDVSFVLDKHT